MCIVMVDWFRIKWCITQVCKTIYFLFTKLNFQILLFQRLFVHETWNYCYNMLIVLGNQMKCINYCKFPNNEYTHVQSSLWPQKNMVCLLWSPKPSCLRPGIYRHSGSWYFTQLSKSWYRKRKKARVFERVPDNFLLTYVQSSSCPQKNSVSWPKSSRSPPSKYLHSLSPLFTHNS